MRVRTEREANMFAGTSANRIETSTKTMPRDGRIEREERAFTNGHVFGHSQQQSASSPTVAHLTHAVVDLFPNRYFARVLLERSRGALLFEAPLTIGLVSKVSALHRRVRIKSVSRMASNMERRSEAFFGAMTQMFDRAFATSR